ncbi:hypothetical protein DL96DRAFT_1708068 [Flagelloscypha sp. PMI_526]|nr:hypothetical protein DL96DRAFT_1708068 [Flagelloscypha sp. PMI_526]
MIAARALNNTPCIERPSRCRLPMEASHILPLDILRLLLEYSASISFKSAQTLSLVSKEVQQWTDPYLFQTVQGARDNHSSMPYLLDRMCMTDASPRFVLARNYVRAIAWKGALSKRSSVKHALDCFPNLTQLCLWGNLFPFRSWHDKYVVESLEITQNYPSLRRVATGIYTQLGLPPDAFGSPFWMTITHLQVNYSDAISLDASAFQLPLFTTMSSLTHLALFPHTTWSESNTDLALSRVRHSFPPSLSLCLLSFVAPEGIDRRLWLAKVANASLKVDKRIVISTSVMEDNEMVTEYGDTFQAWCEVQDGLWTFWEIGEAVLKDREKTI